MSQPLEQPCGLPPHSNHRRVYLANRKSMQRRHHGFHESFPLVTRDNSSLSFPSSLVGIIGIEPTTPGPNAGALPLSYNPSANFSEVGA